MKTTKDYTMLNAKYKDVRAGRLLFLYYIGRHKALWRCDCGKEKIINPYNVMNKNPKSAVLSCGCLQKEREKTYTPPASTVNRNRALKDANNMIGQTFYNLTILESDHVSGSIVTARCVCGNINQYRKSGIKSGHTKSCGCLSQEDRMNTNFNKYGSRTVSVKISKAEIEIMEFLRSIGINDAARGCLKDSENKNVEFDIVCNSAKIAIEHNGVVYHHDRCNGRESRNYHINKTNVAKENGYRLIHIFDFEWKEKQKQIKSFLKSAFNKNAIKIGARKTNIRQISSIEAKTFLREYHILGFKPGIIHFGLFNKEELCAVATFSKHHIDNKGIELSRWCGKENITISGGLSKIMKFAWNELKNKGIEFEKIVSWADRRWSEGTGYLGAGWIIEKTLKPDYFYIDSKDLKNVIYKYRRRKSKMNTPAHMTEKEHSIFDGLFRVWDCGKIRMMYKQN